MEEILNYIKETLPKCVRTNTSDKDTLIGLPYPYYVPCAGGSFQELYYWDTYFTNIGLILSGKIEEAINNAENIAFLIRKYGYMPNGNRTYYIGRSQPPFFSEIIRDIFDKTGDKKWLAQMFDVLETECGFWLSERMTDTGLIHYGYPVSEDRVEYLYKYFNERVGADVTSISKEDVARTTVAGCESGWDFSPRWGVKANEYSQIDLNSLICNALDNLYYFSDVLQNGKAELYKNKAKDYAENIRTLMKSKDDLFYDYDCVNKKLSPVFSCASFYPLATNMANACEAAAAKRNLYRLEQQYGVSACEKYELKGKFQWHYPNGWAPLHYMVIKGLFNYGFTEDAIRIANKFVTLIERNFERTNNLWEKYNVVDGSINVENEYAMPPMMGWTFGVYMYCRQMLADNNLSQQKG